MGTSSTKAKNKYGSKSYDTPKILIYKGQAKILDLYAKAKGISRNALINRALAELMEREPVPGLTFVPMGQGPTTDQPEDDRAEERQPEDDRPARR